MPRTGNDPIDDSGLLAALASVLLPNTALAADGGQVLINTFDPIEQGKTTYPVVVLESGDQTTRHATWRTWQDTLIVKLCYIDRWDTQTTTLSQMRLRIKADLQLIKSNIQDNSNLIVSSTGHAINLRRIAITGYGSRDEKNTPFYTVSGYMSLEFHMPLYLSAR